ncbi:MAG: SpoIIE family protein phosphatase [Pyrinomonadaceae bacterium]|nr:SpoIIE family protein phosphatase [Pyrinomonadaceae bacterium]
MLLNGQHSRRTRLALLLLLALSPVAYLLSIWLITKTDPNTQIGFTINRTGSIRRAADYALTLGTNTEGWTSGCKVEVNNDRSFYFRSRAAHDVEPIRRLAPEAFVNVLFISPDGREYLEVRLAPDGRPIGFERRRSPGQEIADAGEERSRRLAESAFHVFSQDAGAVQFEAPVLKEERSKSSRVIRRYSWHAARTDALPELNLQTTFTVLGEEVTAQRITTEFDPTYANNLISHHQLPQVVVGFYWLFVGIISLYGLYRYIQRTRQKEVPHARSLLLCMVVASLYMFIGLQTDFHIFTQAMSPRAAEGGAREAPPWLFWFILLSTGLVFVTMGLIQGLAYGGGEGDVREAYPGKLASLDALITGRVFSRNVARAVCTGAALGGWALLAEYVVLLPWADRPDTGQGLAKRFYEILFGQYAWPLPLLLAFVGALMATIVGLLLPLSFLARRVRSPRASLGFLFVLSLIASLDCFQNRPLPFAAGMLEALVLTGTLLAAFFAFDLLTAIISLAAPILVTYVVYVVSQPAAGLRQTGFVSVGIALMILAVELYFFYRGREYAEDEVRPLYARHLAERLSLQAEVSTAREAQVRLMPRVLPEVFGVQFAASCLPARVVGGDFYDLFTIDDKRIGIFIAEGGGRGLEAALIIAFAKGFLMPRIERGYRPTEIICDLQHQLAPMLDQNQELSVAYAVLDTSARMLSYARTGSYPQVLISENSNGRDVRQLYAEERKAEASSAFNFASNCEVREATLSLAIGDSVVFFTDGLAQSLNADFKTSTDEWVESVVSAHADGKRGESLQTKLTKALETRAKRTRKIGLEDDLTAVVVQFEAGGEGAAG